MINHLELTKTTKSKSRSRSRNANRNDHNSPLNISEQFTSIANLEALSPKDLLKPEIINNTDFE